MLMIRIITYSTMIYGKIVLWFSIITWRTRTMAEDPFTRRSSPLLLLFLLLLLSLPRLSPFCTCNRKGPIDFASSLEFIELRAEYDAMKARKPMSLLRKV